jgi:hypothetical protein
MDAKGNKISRVFTFQGHGDLVHIPRHDLERVILRSSIFIRDYVTIYILPISKKRDLFAKKLTPKDINGGFYDVRAQTIVIVRFDEYPKVLIHELLHHNLRSIIRPRDWILHLDRVMSPVLLDEALVEAIATMCHVSMLGLGIDREIKWSKSLTHDLLKNQNWPTIPWSETTNVFAYVIVKLFIMSNFETLFPILFDHGAMQKEVRSSLRPFLDNLDLQFQNKEKKTSMTAYGHRF